MILTERYWVLLAIFGLTLVACGSADAWTNPVKKEEIPAPDSPPVNPVVVLFQDDFSDPTSGWDRVRERDVVADYAAGAYKFLLRKSDWYYWSTPKLHFADVRVEVQAAKMSEADISLYGIICRYQNAGDFYFFTVSSDGFFGIGKFKNGQETLLGMVSMQSHPVINQGVATNHLRVECVGDRLRLVVNGTPLAEALDGDFLAGDVGLIASTNDGFGAEIRFDNLTVLEP